MFQDGHYLNLPVMNEPGEIVGMVDVLKLTYATLEQISTMSTGENDSGPAWGKFWLSLDNDSESMVSEGASHRPRTPGHRSGLMTPDSHHAPPFDRVDSVQPHESASHHGDDSRSDSPDVPSPLIAETPFPFKFKAPSGRVHKLQVTASQGVEELVANVIAKLGGEVNAVGGEAKVEDGKLLPTGFAMSYMDNEGDTVSITVDRDIIDAVTLSQRHHREKVDLFVHHPDKAPISATLDPHPAVAKPPTPPPSSIMKHRRRHLEDDDEDEMATPVKKDRRAASRPAQADQVIAGVPNELLLPGAIAALAVVIVGVFAFSRSSKN